MEKSKNNSHHLSFSKQNSKQSVHRPSSKIDQNTPINRIVEVVLPLNIYIDGINTFLSQAIVEEIRNDHKALDSEFIRENKIYGTLNEGENAPPPKGIVKYFTHKQKNSIHKHLFSCDYVVFDINFGGIEEISSIAKTIKENPQVITKDTTILFISSVMGWAKTYPKPEPPVKPEQSEDEDYSISSRKQNKFTSDYLDEDFHIRMPAIKYAGLKQLENLLLSLPKIQPLLKIYILGAGILYGNGENTFYDHFRKSYTGEQLPMVGAGYNCIPTIHVVDISRMIKKILFEGVEQGYILAVDKSQNTLKQILTAIAGNNESKIESVDVLDVYEAEWIDALNLSLKMRTSQKFDQTFQWHCEEGICQNIDKVRDEFVRYRGIQPLKVAIVGPPLTKKTTVTNILSKELNLQGLSIPVVIQMMKEMNERIRDELEQYEEEERARIIEEMEKSKKKQAETTIENIKIRYTEQQVIDCFKETLKLGQIKQKGFILDNYPKSTNQAKRVFCNLNHIKAQDDSVETESQIIDRIPINQCKFIRSLLPDIVFHFKGQREEGQSQLNLTQKSQQDKTIQNSRFLQENIDRRQNIYQDNINDLIQFYKEAGVKVIDIDATSKEEDISYYIKDQIFERYEFLEILFQNDQQEKLKINKLEKADQEKQSFRLMKHQLQKQAEMLKSMQKQKGNQRLDKIQEKKQFLLETRSLPIRMYLNEKVIPFLTEAFIQYTDKVDFSQIPEQADNVKLEEDPLDFVISYLETKGKEIQDKSRAEAAKKLEEEGKHEGEEGSEDDSEGMTSKSQSQV